MDVQNSSSGFRRTAEGLYSSGCEIFSYPIEVCITQIALQTLSLEYTKNGTCSQIHIYTRKQCGGKDTLCGINANFFGYMSNFKDVLSAGNKKCISRAIFEAHSAYMELIKPLTRFESKFQRENEEMLDLEVYKSTACPRLEGTSEENFRLIFPVGGFIQLEKAAITHLYMDRSILSEGGRSCSHGEVEPIVHFDAEYCLGEFCIEERLPMENKFLLDSELPELLRLQMDFIRGQWKLVAEQRLVDSKICCQPKLISAPIARAEQKLLPPEYICPITQEIMTDPVMAMDGHSYERKAIQEWFTKQSCSPITRQLIQPQLLPNRNLLQAIEKWTNSSSQNR